MASRLQLTLLQSATLARNCSRANEAAMTALLVVLTILALLAVDLVVVALRRRRASPQAAAGLHPMRDPQPPFGLFIDPAHSWLRITTDGTLRIGIDDFLAEALGEVEEVQAPTLGTKVKRGDPLLTFRTHGRRLTVRSPASGEVVAVNQSVRTRPETLLHDPYGLGWVVALWTRDHKEAIAPLQIGYGAAAFLRKELTRFVDFLSAQTAGGVALAADGGLPRRGVIGDLAPGALEAFEAQFLCQREGGAPAASTPAASAAEKEV
jgi:glycine cleavage system H protein